MANWRDGRCSGQFSLGFREFCRRHANLRDSANRQIGSPKPFRLFSSEPARFGFAWKSSSLFKHLKIWPPEPSAADLSAGKRFQKPEVDAVERSNAWRMRRNRYVARSSCSPILRQSVRHMTFLSSGRSNHVCYGPIATELVHHGELRMGHKQTHTPRQMTADCPLHGSLHRRGRRLIRNHPPRTGRVKEVRVVKISPWSSAGPSSYRSNCHRHCRHRRSRLLRATRPRVLE